MANNPEVTGSLRAAGVSAGLTPEKLLFVGQMIGNTVPSGTLQENILSDKEEDLLFSPDSPLASAIRRARRRNSESQIDAIGLIDDASGVGASGAFTISGTATAAGKLKFFVGSKKFGSYSVAVKEADTADTLGEALATAINANTQSFVTAANAAGVITLTAKTAGTFGNTIGLRFEGVAEGVTTGIIAMSGGAIDPILTGVFDVVGDNRYQGIVWQFQDNIVEVTDFLDARFNVENDILDGRAFVGIVDTLANHLTTLSALNSKSLCINVDKRIIKTNHSGGAVFELPFIKVAEFAATRALKRTDQAVLGDLVISRSARDGFGGIWQNSKPYANTPFPDLVVPDINDSFTRVEIKQLTAAGGWVIDSNSRRNAVIAGQVVTTYKNDSAGNPDPTFGFLNYVDTSTAGREFIVNNTRAKYPQYRATGGALIPGVDSANEASIAAYVAQLNSSLGGAGVVNTGVGSIDGQAVDYDKLFRENLTVSLNPVTGRFFVAFKMYIVVQLRAVVYDMAVAFEV